MKLLGWNEPISAHPHINGDHATKSNQNADLFVHKRMARNIQKTNIRRTQYSEEAMLRHKTTEVRHTHLHIHIDIRYRGLCDAIVVGHPREPILFHHLHHRNNTGWRTLTA